MQWACGGLFDLAEDKLVGLAHVVSLTAGATPGEYVVQEVAEHSLDEGLLTRPTREFTRSGRPQRGADCDSRLDRANVVLVLPRSRPCIQYVEQALFRLAQFTQPDLVPASEIKVFAPH